MPRPHPGCLTVLLALLIGCGGEIAATMDEVELAEGKEDGACPSALRQIYGQVRDARYDTPLSGMALELEVGDSVAEASTDDEGVYRLTATRAGRGSFRAYLASGEALSVEVTVYCSPVRYLWDVIPNTEGEPAALVRR